MLPRAIQAGFHHLFADAERIRGLLQAGMVAVDPSVIPLKSYVYVKGYKDSYLPQGGFLGHAMDTGGAIKGMRVDIFMNDNPTIVSNFGVQPVTVYVLGN